MDADLMWKIGIGVGTLTGMGYACAIGHYYNKTKELLNSGKDSHDIYLDLFYPSTGEVDLGKDAIQTPSRSKLAMMLKWPATIGYERACKAYVKEQKVRDWDDGWEAGPPRTSVERKGRSIQKS